jgi:(2Fe-2S) ferredoxin
MIKQAEQNENAKTELLIDALSHQNICAESGKDSEEMQALLDSLRRKEVEKPVIYLGAATCGLSAGADKTLTAIEKYIEEKNLDVELVKVGCIGLCSEEPLLDVQLPGKNRVVFRKVMADNVEKILDGVFNNVLEKENVLVQHRNEKLEKWDGVQFLDEHAFFKPQKRCVLANCGIIDPCDINEYLANDGYKAFAKALHSMTPVEVCTEVELSGLRGRGGGGFATGKKWKFALNAQSEQKYIICNADEGDPGAFMDRAVIEGDPHRLLEGIAIACYGIGASKAYIYIRAE